MVAAKLTGSTAVSATRSCRMEIIAMFGLDSEASVDLGRESKRGQTTSQVVYNGSE